MEFAFSALFLLILILPGFILQFTYTKVFWRWNSPTSTQSITEQIPVGIVNATALHLVWTGVCNLLGLAVNLRSVVTLLLGSYGHDDVYFPDTLESLVNNPHKIFFYFATLYSFSALLGYFGHWLVRKCEWDRKFKFLRFNNEWYYLLSGEITQFKEFPENLGVVAGVYLTTIVHHSDNDYLYRGIVADFFFDKSGNLDKVLLRLAHRRALSKDRENNQEYNQDQIDERYYNIEGDYFILQYSEMSTINLDYFFVAEESNPDSSEN